MANVKKFSREEALALREQGYSHKQISVALGCSKAWVAKELMGVEKGEGMAVDGTKVQAIAILEEALAKIRSL
jgi:predicted transcriptional regulator